MGYIFLERDKVIICHCERPKGAGKKETKKGTGPFFIVTEAKMLYNFLK